MHLVDNLITRCDKCLKRQDDYAVKYKIFQTLRVQC